MQMNLSHDKRTLNAHLWARHPEDWYVEEHWVDHRLFEQEAFDGSICDPACGFGRIVEAAHHAGFHDAWGQDKVCRSPYCRNVVDFLSDAHIGERPDNIVSNPPFKVAREFTVKALKVASRKVAMLLPLGWITGDKRSRWLEETRPRRVLILTPRPSMPPGPVIEAGLRPRGGKTNYAWYIWERGYNGEPEFGWLRRNP